MANGVFVEKGYSLNPSYRNVSIDRYQSEVSSLDFSNDPVSATKYINDWVSVKTHGKVPNILSSPISSNAVMVIASALYFKALWRESFIDGATKLRNFFPEGKSQPAVQVEMMAHGGCFPYYESRELEAKIIGFPYKQRLSTMYVIMPKNSTRQRLQELLVKLNSRTINEMIDAMELRTSVILFPKMHITNSLDLRNILMMLGVRSIFNEKTSNLTGIIGDSIFDNSEIAGSPAMSRPTINIPHYRPSIHNQDLHHQLIVHRYQNDSDDTTLEPPTTTGSEESTDTSDIFPTVQLPTKSQTKPTPNRTKRAVSYKVPSELSGRPLPLKSKDFILNKRIVKESGATSKKGLGRRRNRRDSGQAERIYVSNAVHQVDLDINETGTEGGAATIVTLNRSGTSVVFRAEAPFLVLIRNDQTKLPLFFGAVYDPRG